MGADPDLVQRLVEAAWLRLVDLTVAGLAVLLAVVVLGLGWLLGYLRRCRDERDLLQLSDSWRSEQLQREHEHDRQKGR